MKKIWIVLGILVVIVLVLYSQVKGTYNTLIGFDESVKSAWAEVENQMQRRADLVPNLVNTVKGYAAHEEGVLTEVTNARARVGGAQTPAELNAANNQLSSALSRLLVVVENYPNLKANQNFLDLQTQLEGTENRLANARRYYIEAVRAYNQTVRSFPTNILAGFFGFAQAETFEGTEESRTVPTVEF